MKFNYDCFVNVESMMRLGLLGGEFYPERGGVQNCAYYMRTGSCGYGNKCRYNHPRDRNLVSADHHIICILKIVRWCSYFSIVGFNCLHLL